MEEFVISSIARSRTETEEAVQGGEYLPLSVYKQRGFPTELIEERCKDVRDHEMLGPCYRLVIDGVYSTVVETMIRSELMDHKRAAGTQKLKRLSGGQPEGSAHRPCSIKGDAGAGDDRRHDTCAVCVYACAGVARENAGVP